ncbi:MAG: sulfotransferase domain-containing protein [Gammaproteobacteria bacterium]|nr:sulfotransferase domain-containing protein [Gammaproteobacteria bacterium]
MKPFPSEILTPDQKKIAVIKHAAQLDTAYMDASGGKKALLHIQRQFQPYYFMQAPLWRTAIRSFNNKNRVKPDFFSVGAVRSGTTMLADYIMQHPCIVLPLAKEIGMRDAPISRLLEAQFPTEKESRMIKQKYGTAKTAYCSPVAPSLLFPLLARNVNAKGKVLLIMRNPIDRAFSHWRWDQVFMKKLKKDKLWKNFPDFDALIKLEIEASEQKATTGITLAGAGCGGYLQHSIYLPFIQSLHQHFGKQNVLLIKAEDFFKNPSEVAKTVYQYFELPEYEPQGIPIGNAGPKGTMSEETRDSLHRFFAPLNAKLYDYIGEDYGW